MEPTAKLKSAPGVAWLTLSGWVAGRQLKEAKCIPSMFHGSLTPFPVARLQEDELGWPYSLFQVISLRTIARLDFHIQSTLHLLLSLGWLTCSQLQRPSAEFGLRRLRRSKQGGAELGKPLSQCGRKLCVVGCCSGPSESLSATFV